MARAINRADLEAYLDEALPPAEMARIEAALRSDRALVSQLSLIHSRRDAGVHTLGEIWRSHRLTCPNREQLGSFLLGAMDPAHDDYVRFHLTVVGCRRCQANLADLENEQAESVETTASRRRRYFQSSAGYLRKE